MRSIPSTTLPTEDYLFSLLSLCMQGFAGFVFCYIVFFVYSKDSEKKHSKFQTKPSVYIMQYYAYLYVDTE